MNADNELNERKQEEIILPEEDENILKPEQKSEISEKPKYLIDYLNVLKKIKLPLPAFLFKKSEFCKTKHYHPCGHHIISGTLDAFTKGYLLKAFFSIILALLKFSKSKKRYSIINQI